MASPLTWREIQRQNFTDWKKLFTFLKLKDDSVILKSPRFSLNVPLRLAEKIEKGNINDPILRQFLPLAEENAVSPDFLQDPVSDLQYRKEKKFLHKYKARALILASSSCAMHCRFCFRQNFPYEKQEKEFSKEIEAIEKEKDLSEIILSGGDPLSLSDAVLENLISRLSKIPHLKRLRFHTRFPIGIPERIDDSFLKVLSGTHLQVVFVVHTNHPKELDEEVLFFLKKVQKLGIPILTHSVLLKGVNDDLLVLKELFEKLSNAGILPYYLNQLDRVQGTQHFEVDIEQGKRLIEALRTQLSGYALPRYVQEIPGLPYKTPLSDS